MKSWYDKIFLLAMIALVGLSGCSKSEPLKVATHDWIGYESLFLAQELDYLPQEIEIVRNQSASDSLERIEAGLVDAATLTLDEVLQARARGTELSVVLVMDISNGADAFYAREPMTDFSQLKGKRIAYEKGAVGELVLFSLLSKAKLSFDEVLPITFPVNRMDGVWRNNLVDVLICYEPIASLVEQSGGVRIFDSKQMPNMIVDVLVVRTEALKQKPQAIKALIRGHFEALSFIEQEKAKALTMIANRNGESLSSLQKALEGIRIPDLMDNHRLLESDGLLQQAAITIQGLLLQRAVMDGSSNLRGLSEAGMLPVIEKN